MGRGSCWAILCDNNSRRELGEWEHCASWPAIILFTRFTFYVIHRVGVIIRLWEKRRLIVAQSPACRFISSFLYIRRVCSRFMLASHSVKLDFISYSPQFSSLYFFLLLFSGISRRDKFDLSPRRRKYISRWYQLCDNSQKSSARNNYHIKSVRVK